MSKGSYPSMLTIYYNKEPVSVDKSKFAFYSERFKNIKDFGSIRSLQINGTASLDTFKEFINGAQGKSFEMSIETSLDILNFSHQWKVADLEYKMIKFVEKNNDLEGICEKMINNSELHNCDKLLNLLACNLKVLVRSCVFEQLPLDLIQKLINHPNRIISNEELFTFTMKMFNKHQSEANCLVQAINFRLLSSEDIQILLNCSSLHRSDINTTICDATLDLIHENCLLKDHLKETNEKISEIIKKLDTLENGKTPMNLDSIIEKIVARLKNSNGHEDHFQEFDKKFTDIDSQIITTTKYFQNDIKNRIVESEKKMRKDLNPIKKSLRKLTTRIDYLESQIETVKDDQFEEFEKIASISKSLSKLDFEMQDFKEPKQLIAHAKCYAGMPFAGIIAQLTHKAQMNIHLAGIVKITSSSSDYNEPYQVADIGWNDVWFTENSENQWIKFDFLKNRVKISNYTIKTHKYKEDSCHLKCWILEGSYDDENWYLLDNRSIDVLNGPNRFQTFPCENKEDAFRYIKLTQIGTNSRGDNTLALNNLEFFGEYIECKPLD